MKDKEFVCYMQQKKDDYDEGASVNPDQLMNIAANKFKLLKQDGQWEAPDAHEEKILALEAQVSNLCKRAHQLREKSWGHNKKPQVR